LNEIGRLDSDDRRELLAELDEIYKLLDKDKIKVAEKRLIQVSKTPNYFVREYLGKCFTNYENKEKMLKIVEKMLKHRIYGVRATALFYLFNVYYDDVNKLFDLIEATFDSVPWEVETVVNDLWKRFPELMKERMKSWVISDHYRKRALAFHGMEHIASSDPTYIMDLVGKTIDDEAMEVQKKITHILSQVAKVNPIIVFPYIREWLAEANDERIKTIWIAMKKLANLVVQKNRFDHREEFVILTEQTIEDWRHDENEKVTEMGERLFYIINR